MLKITDCERCHLHKFRTKVVRGTGPMKKHWAYWHGEGPGGDEDKLGWSFVGRAGVVLDGWIERVGVQRGEVRVNNPVHCRHCNSKNGKNRKPTEEELQACRIWMDKELKSLKPRIIIALGGTSLNSLLQDQVER